MSESIKFIVHLGSVGLTLALAVPVRAEPARAQATESTPTPAPGTSEPLVPSDGTRTEPGTAGTALP
ncbi:MAG: hypothetical protein RJA70_1764, partial [Pseudomonadota bacterium]